MPTSLLRKPFPLRHQQGINHIAFSDDGLAMATGDVAMDIEVSYDGRVIQSFDVGSDLDKVRPTERIRGLAFSPDGKHLHVVAADRLSTFGTKDAQEKWHYTPPRSFGFLVISPMCLSVALDGKIAVGFDNGTVGVWSPDGEKLGMWRDVDVQRQLEFLPDCQTLIGTDSFGVSVFDSVTRKRTRRFRLEERAYGMAVAPHETLYAVRTLHDVLVVDHTNGETILKTPVEPGLPLVKFHPSRDLLVLSNANGAHFVDFRGVIQNRIEIPDAGVCSIGFTPSGQELVVGCSDHKVRRYTV